MPLLLKIITHLNFLVDVNFFHQVEALLSIHALAASTETDQGEDLVIPDNWHLGCQVLDGLSFRIWVVALHECINYVFLDFERQFFIWYILPELRYHLSPDQL